MTKSTRRSFLKTASIVGGAVASAGYLVAEGNAQHTPAVTGDGRTNVRVACIGVGGKGGSDSAHAARFGNIVAICDVDRRTLEGAGRRDGFQTAARYTDFREMLTEHENEIDMVTVSGPDHMHGPAVLMAMRMGKHCFVQKPLTRTVYEARLMAKLAKEYGLCTQMGNQGVALDNHRTAVSLLKAGIIGEIQEVIIWTNRPVWAQVPYRRENMASFAANAYRQVAEGGVDRHDADRLIWNQFEDINRDLENLDWKSFISVAPYRDYFPGLYHPFEHRGWWDFGTGAIGDMACHYMAIPYEAADMKNPTWIRARTSGHDFDSYPEASIIEFSFPANENRGILSFSWYDRRGNRPPSEIFARYGIEEGEIALHGTLIIGSEGAMYGTGDNSNDRRFLRVGGERINEDVGRWAEVKANTVLAVHRGGNDPTNMYELFRAIVANDPSIARSNVVDTAGGLTETGLLGNLAVWAAPFGAGNNQIGDWGERIVWDAENLAVTNLSRLRTPGIAELVKPTYSEGYRLD